jgi:hypothetical protein
MWGAKSPNNEKIVAMATALTKLKGKLKLDDKLAAIKKGGGNNKGGLLCVYERSCSSLHEDCIKHNAKLRYIIFHI